MHNREKGRQLRVATSQFQTRANETGDLYISGYFAVFNSNYEICTGATESIDPHAFDETLSNDIRCLIDHETRLVLGRGKAGTLTLKADSRGLWGEVKINPKDQDAMNLYERVKRGDVDQCSFGFDILEESWEEKGDTIHWIIKKVYLYEVSIVTFPAYENTSVSVRRRQFEEIRKKTVESFKLRMKSKIKGETK